MHLDEFNACPASPITRPQVSTSAQAMMTTHHGCWDFTPLPPKAYSNLKHPNFPKLILLSRYLNNESRTTTYQRHFPHTPPNQPSLIIPTPGKPPSIHPLDDHPPPTRAPAAPGQHPPPGRPRQAGQTGSGVASGSRGWMCGIGAMVMAWVLRAKTASKKMAMISIFGWVGRLGKLVT